MSKKVLAIKNSYRQGLGAVVEAALAEAGIVGVEIAQFHIPGTVSLVMTAPQLDAARAAIPGWSEYGPHRNNGEIEVTFDATESYFAENSPVLTEQERAARESGKGSGKVSSKQE